MNDLVQKLGTPSECDIITLRSNIDALEKVHSFWYELWDEDGCGFSKNIMGSIGDMMIPYIEELDFREKKPN
tara:strand:+ start:428 stop:643 length:216 start_codon:yes stop_codon:yes gene_type:complete